MFLGWNLFFCLKKEERDWAPKKKKKNHITDGALIWEPTTSFVCANRPPLSFVKSSRVVQNDPKYMAARTKLYLVCGKRRNTLQLFLNELWHTTRGIERDWLHTLSCLVKHRFHRPNNAGPDWLSNNVSFRRMQVQKALSLSVTAERFSLDSTRIQQLSVCFSFPLKRHNVSLSPGVNLHNWI